MTILVTGGAGYIGSHTCVELLNQGYDVVVVDNLVNSSKLVIDRIRQITGKEVSFYEMDVRNREGLTAIFDKHPIDCVIHFAGLKAVGESVVMPLEYYDNNLNSSIVLCQVMRDHGVKRIIFSSSATVYSQNNDLPLQESAYTGMCTSPYGWTKYMTEQILRDTAASDEDWSIALLRYFNPIGAHSSGLIGESPLGVPNNLLPYVAQVAVGFRPHLNVFGNDYDTPDGTCIRDYIHVVDLAKGHVSAIHYLQDNYGEHVFNLGTGNGHSVLEVVKTFEAVSGQPIPYVFAPRRPGDVASVYACPDKSTHVLGWKAELTLEDMCRDAWNWQSKNPMGYSES